MPIERLQIRNFRTHEKLDIDFSPLVNSIIGRNAIGKSTIIRAIRWVVRNKPAGDSVINWDADKAAVRLIINKNKITRTRGKNINTYRLYKNKPYKAFRNEVPEDIKKIINLSDINFQGQHEAPFWFSETAGEVSRQLNAIVNLEGIDNTLKNITSALHKSRTAIEIIEERLVKITAQQDSLVYVEKMDEDLKGVEHVQIQYQEKAVELTRLRDISKLVRIHASKRKNALESIVDGQKALSKGQTYRKLAIQAENLSKVVKLGGSLLITINKRPPSLNQLEIFEKRQETIINRYNELKNLIYKIETHRKMKCQLTEDLREYKKEMKKIAKGRCPLCGAKTS